MAIQMRLLPLHDAMFCESNPGPVKYAASLLGFGTNTVRLPLAPVAEANAARMQGGDAGSWPAELSKGERKIGLHLPRDGGAKPQGPVRL